MPPAGAPLASRPWRRRAWFGLLTLFGLAERGFFIPHRHAASAAPDGTGRRPAYAPVEALFAARQGDFAAVLGWLDALRDDLRRIGADPAPAPRWRQDWFPRLDAAVAYAVVRRLRPKRILEVGSGHSTRFLARALEDAAAAGELDPGDHDLLAIDPSPRADLSVLADAGRLRLVRSTLQDADRSAFEALRDGDLLSIDSSHVLMPGSDVDLLFGHLLPALPDGLVLHVHDVFLPDDYPADWAWRGYNEQLAVLPLLFGGWEVLFAAHYAATRMAAAVAGSAAGALPLGPDARESGLWLRKRAAPAAATGKTRTMKRPMPYL